MQFFFKNILRGLEFGLFTSYLSVSRIFFKYRRSSKTKQLCIREKILDSLVVFSKLRTMTFVKNKYNPAVLYYTQTILIVTPTRWIKSNTQFLNCCHYNLVGIIFRKHPTNKSIGICIFFYTPILKAVKFFTRLLIKVLSIYDKQTFLYFRNFL